MPCSTAAGVTLRSFAPEFLLTYAAANNRASEVVSKEMILNFIAEWELGLPKSY